MQCIHLISIVTYGKVNKRKLRQTLSRVSFLASILEFAEASNLFHVNHIRNSRSNWPTRQICNAQIILAHRFHLPAINHELCPCTHTQPAKRDEKWVSTNASIRIDFHFASNTQIKNNDWICTGKCYRHSHPSTNFGSSPNTTNKSCSMDKCLTASKAIFFNGIPFLILCAFAEQRFRPYKVLLVYVYACLAQRQRDSGVEWQNPAATSDWYIFRTNTYLLYIIWKRTMQ